LVFASDVALSAVEPGGSTNMAVLQVPSAVEGGCGCARWPCSDNNVGASGVQALGLYAQTVTDPQIQHSYLKRLKDLLDEEEEAWTSRDVA